MKRCRSDGARRLSLFHSHVSSKAWICASAAGSAEGRPAAAGRLALADVQRAQVREAFGELHPRDAGAAVADTAGKPAAIPAELFPHPHEQRGHEPDAEEYQPDHEDDASLPCDADRTADATSAKWPDEMEQGIGERGACVFHGLQWDSAGLRTFTGCPFSEATLLAVIARSEV